MKLREKVLLGLLALAVILWGIRERTWSHTVSEETFKASEADRAYRDMLETARTLDKQNGNLVRENEALRSQLTASSKRSAKTRIETRVDGSRIEETEEHAEQLEEHILTMARDFEQIQFELEAQKHAEIVKREQVERELNAERQARLDAEAKASKTPWGSLLIGGAIGAGATYGVMTLTR